MRRRAGGRQEDAEPVFEAVEHEANDLVRRALVLPEQTHLPSTPFNLTTHWTLAGLKLRLFPGGASLQVGFGHRGSASWPMPSVWGRPQKTCPRPQKTCPRQGGPGRRGRVLHALQMLSEGDGMTVRTGQFVPITSGKIRTWSRPLETSAVQTTRTTRGHGLVVDSVRASVCTNHSGLHTQATGSHRKAAIRLMFSKSLSTAFCCLSSPWRLQLEMAKQSLGAGAARKQAARNECAAPTRRLRGGR